MLMMDGHLDVHFVNFLEQKFKDCRFVRVDSDVVDKLIQKEEHQELKLTDKQRELTTLFSQIPQLSKSTLLF